MTQGWKGTRSGAALSRCSAQQRHMADQFGNALPEAFALQQPRKKTALEISDEFLVSELQSNEGKAPKRGLWGAAIHRTTPPPGWGIPRGMTGGGPVDTAVTSPCPLLTGFIPKAPGFPRTHMGAVTSNGYKNKTAGS